MKHTIDFNEHLDAQARAYEIGKAEALEQARVSAQAGQACCGKVESCCSPCVPRANYFKNQRDQLLELFEQTPFRKRPEAFDYGVKPGDIAKISTLCKNIRSVQKS